MPVIKLPTRPLTYDGHSFVGWALYYGEDEYPQQGEQSEQFALSDFQAKVWLANNPTRKVVPVYSDTWIYKVD
jgi:hypothetical protein